MQNASLPFHPVLRGLQDQSKMPRPPGASGKGSPLTPGMSPVWTTLSTKHMGLIQSCQNPDLQDSGHPRGHCPTSWAPHVTNSITIAPAPFVQGEGAVSLTSPSPLPGPPPGKGAFGQPLDLVAATPAHSTPCPPQKGCVCRGHQPNNALLSSTVTPRQVRGKEQRIG